MSLKDTLNFENTGNLLDIFAVSRGRGEEIFNEIKRLWKEEMDLEDDAFDVNRYLKQCMEIATNENEERYCLFTAAEILGRYKEINKNHLAAFFAQI